jgi:hypothetical protein
MIERAQRAPERPTDTGRIRTMLDEITVDDVDRTRRAAMIVQLRGGGGSPPNQPDVVRRAPRDAGKRALTRPRFGDGLEVRREGVVDRDRAEEARRQRKRGRTLEDRPRRCRCRLDDVHDASFRGGRR